MELWKTIVDFPDYEISNTGKVRSRERVQYVNGRWGMMHRKLKPKHLKLYKVGDYLGVRFTFHGKNFYIHRLVAQNFVNGDTSLVVNHKDGNKHNNHFENLEWVTLSENAKHSTHVLGKTGGQFKKKQQPNV